jgi:NAD(P)-dependent dehydrogenase (short-subunit alcohol dehydrogenase family)
MDIAIVTGAETPLGLRLIQRLVRQGYRVHGIGNNFSKVTFADPQFSAHPVDLSDLTAVTETMGKIIEGEKSLDLLVHAIDVTPGAAFEKLSVGNLEAVLKIGLLGPVMLTRLALPNLLRFRGQLINVIPANKSGAPASAVNALLEGGFREMNRALFDGARDAGLRVTNLILRQNPDPDALSVQSSEQTHIDLEDVARAVEHLLDPNFANVPAELVLHPRSSAHSDQVLPEVSLPLDPYREVVLPPKAYCPPKQPKIPTQEKEKVERTIPYTDDEMEDKIAAAIEDFEAHPERYEQPRQSERKPERQSERKPGRQPEQGGQGAGGQQDSSDNNKRRRGRRRGGRNRNRDRDPNTQPQGQPQGGSPHNEGGQSKPKDSRSHSPQENKPQNDSGNQPNEKSKRPQRRGRTKPEPKPQGDPQSKPQHKSEPKVKAKPQVNEVKPEAVKKKVAKKVPKASKVEQKLPRETSTPKKKVAKKIPAKKAAKKATKKIPAKKATKKKATKKKAKQVEPE